MREEKFKLEKLLGTGGFAQTWLARVVDPVLLDEWETEVVALKIPLSREKEIVLKKELELNASLYLQVQKAEAENIVKYLGFDTYEEKIVMVMSYVSGGNLRQVMGGYRRTRPMERQQAVSIAEGVLRGLSVIHKYSIVHRDIKPENILMDGNTPKISDLGIGRMLKSNELASTSVGTIFYLSPEMLFEKGRGTGASFNTDVWSFGVTFYEMLCGCFPFGINTDMRQGDIINNIEDPNKPLEFPPEADIPPKLQTVICKALQRDPGDRYQAANEMLQSLTELSKVTKEKRSKDEKEERIEREINSILYRFADPSQTENVETILKQILKQHPGVPCVYLKFGEFYNKRGSYKKAITMFEKGLELDSDNPLLHWGLAIACLELDDLAATKKSIKQALDAGLEASLERYAKLLLAKIKNKGGVLND